MRQIAVELGAAIAAVIALVLALAAASWAAAEVLSLAVAPWGAALIVAAFWAIVAGLLFRLDHPRSLLARLRQETGKEALESAGQARIEAEQRVKATAERLGETVAREAAEREIGAGVSAAERLAEAAEHDAEDVLKELIAALLAPGKAGISVLERIVGRQRPRQKASSGPPAS